MRRRAQAARDRHDVRACAPKRQTQQNPTAIGVTLAGERAVASTPRRDLQEPETGIEPVTSILPRLRSTTELLGPKAHASRRPDTRPPEVGSGGFEPPKAEPTDLQSVPFVHFGNCPDRVPQATSRQANLSDAAQNYHLRNAVLSSCLIELSRSISLYLALSRSISLYLQALARRRETILLPSAERRHVFTDHARRMLLSLTLCVILGMMRLFRSPDDPLSSDDYGAF